jgi:hypothetical protein
MAWNILRMPNRHPMASAILTMIFVLPIALVGPLFAVSAVAALASGSPDPSAGQTALIGVGWGLAGLVFLGLTVSAVRDTNWFRNWSRSPDGTMAHKIVRWAGPLSLFLSIFEVFIVIWLTLWFFQAFARSLQS